MKRLLVFLAVLLTSVLGLSACTGGASGYAYVFDGDTTTQATVDRELEALKNNKLFAQALKQGSSPVSLSNSNGSINAEVSAAWVNAMVQYEAIDRAVKAQKIPVTAADRQQATTQVTQLFGTAQVFSKFPKWFQVRELAREARKVAFVRKVATVPTEADAQAYFNQNITQICPSGKAISHILVATQAEADAIEQELAAGGDFATIAKQKSTDTQSGAEGGLLGCLVGGPDRRPSSRLRPTRWLWARRRRPVQIAVRLPRSPRRRADLRAVRDPGAHSARAAERGRGDRPDQQAGREGDAEAEPPLRPHHPQRRRRADRRAEDPAVRNEPSTTTTVPRPSVHRRLDPDDADHPTAITAAPG